MSGRKMIRRRGWRQAAKPSIRCLLDLDRNGPEEAGEQPDRERQRERGPRDDHALQRPQQAHLVVQPEERDQQDNRREHLGDEDQVEEDLAAPELVTGQDVGPAARRPK